MLLAQVMQTQISSVRSFDPSACSGHLLLVTRAFVRGSQTRMLQVFILNFEAYNWCFLASGVGVEVGSNMLIIA